MALLNYVKPARCAPGKSSNWTTYGLPSRLDGYWAWLAGLTIPFFVSVIWSVSLSPKAPRPLPIAAKITTRLVLLLAGAAAWWLADLHVAAIATAASALVGTAIATRWPFDMPGVADAKASATSQPEES